MTPLDIRLEALRIAMSPENIPANYDAQFFIERAREFENYLLGAIAKQSQGVVKPRLVDKPRAPPKPEG
jgi:hypothetical protein